MFARVQTIRQPAEQLDALAKLAGEQVSAAPRPPGFEGFFYLVDRVSEKALVISLWETEGDLRQLEANNAPARAQVKTNAQLDSPPSEIFEVAFSS